MEEGTRVPSRFFRVTNKPGYAAKYFEGRSGKMNFETVKTKIEEWLVPFLTERNFFLVDIKFSMGKKIEVFVDSDTGIHIEECAQVSRFVEANLDGSGLVPDNYILEVSSPGMSNPLKVPRQYKRRIGRKLEVLKTNGEMLLAQLVAVKDEGIVLSEVKEEKSKKKQKEELVKEQQAAKEFELKFSEIKRAVLVFNF